MSYRYTFVQLDAGMKYMQQCVVVGNPLPGQTIEENTSMLMHDMKEQFSGTDVKNVRLIVQDASTGEQVFNGVAHVE